MASPFPLPGHPCPPVPPMVEGVRRQAYLLHNSPTPERIPLDQQDCLGTSPYVMEEVGAGVWRVTYTVETLGLTGAKTGLMDTDWTSEAVRGAVLAGAATEGEVMVEVAKADLSRAAAWWMKREWGREERLAAPATKLVMLVVRLASGGLLLYGAVRAREEVVAWLAALGRVEWVVAPAAYHTLFLPSMLAEFPRARLLAPAQAAAKLRHVGALASNTLHFDSSNMEEMSRTTELLATEGVEVLPLQGDVAEAILVAAHGFLLVCDIVYGRPGGGFMGLTGEELREGREEHTMARLFKFLKCNKPNSPNSRLANYRFYGMDPSSLGGLMWDLPTAASCPAMAASLRAALDRPFTAALGIHFRHMAREAFRQTVDLTWVWLDGNSLL